MNGKKVFLVHGHDREAREQVETFLRDRDLEPVVLEERPGASYTIIELVTEKYADVDYAVILLTPDDGCLPRSWPQIREHPDPSQKWVFRARQNVIFEYGFFIGKLGRPRVVALQKKFRQPNGKLVAIDFPSDLFGVRPIEMDELGEWRAKLERELRDAGVIT